MKIVLYIVLLLSIVSVTSCTLEDWKKIEDARETLAEDIAGTIISITDPVQDATELILPLYSGFTISIEWSSDETVIGLDATIYPPTSETIVDLKLRIENNSDSSDVATSIVISVTVPARS